LGSKTEVGAESISVLPDPFEPGAILRLYWRDLWLASNQKVIRNADGGGAIAVLGSASVLIRIMSFGGPTKGRKLSSPMTSPTATFDPMAAVQCPQELPRKQSLVN
jgi:hypothetical protein